MFSRVIVLLLVLVRGGFSICPHAEFIQPCTCKSMVFGNHIVCPGINSTELMSDVFSVLSSYEINTLLLNGLRVDTLPANIFVKLRIRNLRFTDSVFSFSSDGLPLAGLENTLKLLDLMNCNVADNRLTNITFTHLQQLTEVNVNFDSINRIGGLWFHDGPISIKFLRLDHNEIRTIEDNAFSGLKHLEVLSLADNKLSSINRNILPRPAAFLKLLDLSYNELDSLPENFFRGMTQLKRVVLSQNKFQTLPQATWQGVWRKLEYLFLKNNPIICDDQIRWVYQEKLPDHLDGRCIAPEELSGTALSGLTIEQLCAQ